MTSFLNPIDAGIYDHPYLFAQSVPTSLEGARVKASLDNVAVSLSNLSLSIHSSTEGLRGSMTEEMATLSSNVRATQRSSEAKSVDHSLLPSIKKLLKTTTSLESHSKTIDASLSILSDNLTRSMEEIQSGIRVQAVREQLMATKIDQLESRLQQRENINYDGDVLRALAAMEKRLMKRIQANSDVAGMPGERGGMNNEITNRPISTPATTPRNFVELRQLSLSKSRTSPLLSQPHRDHTSIRHSPRTISTSDTGSSGHRKMSRTASKKRKIQQSQSDAEPDTEEDVPQVVEEADTEEDDWPVEQGKAESDGGEFDPEHDPAAL